MTKSQEFGIERKCVGEGRRRERAGGGSSYTESTGGESAQQERLTTFVLIHNYYRGGGGRCRCWDSDSGTRKGSDCLDRGGAAAVDQVSAALRQTAAHRLRLSRFRLSL